MTQPTQPLRDEHKELLPYINLLRTVADAVGTEPSTEQGIEDTYLFLTHHLIPHAQAEEQALYPVVGALLKAPAATATMSREHQEIKNLTGELGAYRQKSGLSESQNKDLRRILYGLYTLVKVHLAEEEEIYLPLLDAHLTRESANQLFKNMEIAAQKAKSLA
jgi:hemerythrin-like domain-containing protein